MYYAYSVFQETIEYTLLPIPLFEIDEVHASAGIRNLQNSHREFETLEDAKVYFDKLTEKATGEIRSNENGTVTIRLIEVEINKQDPPSESGYASFESKGIKFVSPLRGEDIVEAYQQAECILEAQRKDRVTEEQICILERYGFTNVKYLTKTQAEQSIAYLESSNRWRNDMDPENNMDPEGDIPW